MNKNENLFGEVYETIPTEMRKFIKDTNIYLERQEGNRSDTVDADCHMEDIKTQATFYFKDNVNEAIVARLDYIDSVEDFMDYVYGVTEDKEAETIKKETIAKHQEVVNIVEKNGFKFVYSHHCEAFYGWWDIIIQQGTWNEEGFIESWKAVDNFNGYVRKIAEKLNLYY